MAIVLPVIIVIVVIILMGIAVVVTIITIRPTVSAVPSVTHDLRQSNV